MEGDGESIAGAWSSRCWSPLRGVPVSIPVSVLPLASSRAIIHTRACVHCRTHCIITSAKYTFNVHATSERVRVIRLVELACAPRLSGSPRGNHLDSRVSLLRCLPRGPRSSPRCPSFRLLHHRFPLLYPRAELFQSLSNKETPYPASSTSIPSFETKACPRPACQSLYPRGRPPHPPMTSAVHPKAMGRLMEA